MRRKARLALLLVIAAHCGACGRDARVENAVLICLDTVRYDTLEMVGDAAGDDAAARPWRAGTRLVRVQSTAPWTLPAVASVFTGRYPNGHRAGSFLGEVANIQKGLPLPLPPGLPTLPTVLSEKGFETVGFVGHPWFQQGFGLDRGFSSLDLSTNEAGALVDHAEAWLDARGARPDAPPFFLYLHFMEAHAPTMLGRGALDPLVERLSPALRERAIASKPSLCSDPGSLGCLRYLGYVAAVSGLRDEVARVLTALEARGLRGSTAVVLFADHGEEFLDHRAEEASRSLIPIARFGIGHGHSLYQEQLHVPVVIWHPTLAPGDVDLPASLVDIAPTLLGWLGVEADPGTAGQDLGPQLAQRVPPDPDRPLFSSSVAFGPEREAVVRGERKWIADGGSGVGSLLFDLSRDPLEKKPVDPQAGGELAAPDLAALLAEYRGLRRPGGEPVVPDREELEALQALGYLEEAGVE
jgi:arylsulfatase A-like enzyme